MKQLIESYGDALVESVAAIIMTGIIYSVFFGGDAFWEILLDLPCDETETVLCDKSDGFIIRLSDESIIPGEEICLNDLFTFDENVSDTNVELIGVSDDTGSCDMVSEGLAAVDNDKGVFTVYSCGVYRLRVKASCSGKKDVFSFAVYAGEN